MNPFPVEKKNCWEVMNCGREPGGAKVHELGVCLAATSQAFDGINGGHNGGRFCWAVAGTFCDGQVQGTFAVKILTCIKCPFFQQVKQEEGLFDFHFAAETKDSRINKPGV